MPKMKITCLFLILSLPLANRVDAQAGQLKDPEITSIRNSTDSVAVFDKFEVGLNLHAVFANPFNPDEINLEAVFTAPSGKLWTIHGFYNYSYGSVWKIRFAPNEVGAWSYIVRVTDKNGKTSSAAKSFTAAPSSNGGPLRLAANKRYLEHANGTSFYGVGFWYNDAYTGFNSGQIKAETLDNLKKLGVNFIGTFITPLETQASGLGRYDQNICGRLDELLKYCEDRDMQLSLNLWFHAFLSDTVWGGGNIRWYANPYQQITAAKDFYRSKEAWNYQEKLYRYFIARWGYSRSLADWFIIDEVNGTQGWATGDSAMAFNWAKNVHNYFKQNDPYQHLTTGTRSGGVGEFWNAGYQTFDLAAREIYEAQGFPMNRSGSLDSVTVHPLAQSYFTYAGEVGKLWKNYEKPAIIGESGWDHTFYEPGMPGYLALYHNALWASLASGSAMTPFWWAYSNRLNDMIVSAQITSIRRFSADIPFEKLSNLSKAEISVSSGDGFAIKSNEMIFGWVVNPQTDVAGKTVQIKNVGGNKYKLRIYHTWRGQYLDTVAIAASNGSLSFTIPVLHMDSHANYIGQDIAFIIEPADAVDPRAKK
jgi:hypothetical protein